MMKRCVCRAAVKWRVCDFDRGGVERKKRIMSEEERRARRERRSRKEMKRWNEDLGGERKKENWRVEEWSDMKWKKLVSSKMMKEEKRRDWRKEERKRKEERMKGTEVSSKNDKRQKHRKKKEKRAELEFHIWKTGGRSEVKMNEGSNGCKNERQKQTQGGRTDIGRRKERKISGKADGGIGSERWRRRMDSSNRMEWRKTKKKRSRDWWSVNVLRAELLPADSTAGPGQRSQLTHTHTPVNTHTHCLSLPRSDLTGHSSLLSCENLLTSQVEDSDWIVRLLTNWYFYVFIDTDL